MAPRQRHTKIPVTASAAAAGNAGSAADGPAVHQEEVANAQKSYLTLGLLGISLLLRSIALPYYTTFYITGRVSRWSYPSQYTAPGVVCNVEALDGPKFCEHEIIFEDQGVALLSCDPGRGEWNTVMGPLTNPDPRGKLWLYDYANTKTSKEIELDGFPVDADFHPLGMNYYADATKSSLFVINHQRTGPTIETFSIDFSAGMSTNSVNYEKTIAATTEIRSANSIVALDHKHLYVTNDHAWPRLEHGHLWAEAETYLATIFPQTFITHVDLTGPQPSFIQAYEGLSFANGIAIGSNGTLYAASSVAGTVTILTPVSSENHRLRRNGEVQFGYTLDNVHVIPGSKPELDTLVVGGHPNTIATSRLAKNPHAGSQKSPSWISIARLRQPAGGSSILPRVKPEGWHEPRANAQWEMRTIYEDDGSHFSTATGASVDLKRDALLAPGLYETGLLVCRGIKNIL